MTATDRLIAFLGDPVSYAHRPANVEIVQTHISVVALAGDLVFKVKKPLNLGFLDFSTLEKRRFYCESEVQLNRRLCEHVYLGVSPIYLERGALSFEGSEDGVVDYAVRMRRIDEDCFLHRLIERNEVTQDVMDRLKRRLAAFYDQSPRTSEIAKWGEIARLRISTDENFDQLHAIGGTLVTGATLGALRFFTDRFYDMNAALFARRRTGGHIRDCHGDLHAEHIAVGEDICIYDCIEFSERLRYIDVANDVAFLYMDLVHRGSRQLAESFLGDMAVELGDADMTRLVRFYATYRAIVRGKVNAMRSGEPEVPEEERSAAAAEAESFFRLALDLAVTDLTPSVFVVFGGVGTGKSTVANALGALLGWDVVSSDAERKRMQGVPEYRRGTAAERSELYKADVTDRVYKALISTTVEHVDSGRSVILDATFSKRSYRDDFRSSIAGRVPYRMIEMKATREAVGERLRARATGLHVSDARLEDLDNLWERYEPPDSLEDAWHFRVDTSAGFDRDETILRVLRHLIRLG